MKINHRIALRADDPFWRGYEPLGLPIDRSELRWSMRGDGSDLIWVANITEDHEAWPQVERMLATHGSSPELINLIFTRDETDSAEWLEVGAVGHHGYPQPEDDFGYLEATYDTGAYCRHCGIGAVQKAPFRLRAEPQASHSQFIQLNWVFDEFFVRKAAQEGIAAAGLTGMEFIAPVLHKSGRPSGQVAQMRIAAVLDPALLEFGGLEPVLCTESNEPWSPNQPGGFGSWSRGHPYCARVKYGGMPKGPFRFRRDAFDGAPDVVKSHEWFGGGGAAWRTILVSQRFRRLVLGARWRGISFEPIELVD
jgi:hypothetical protein